MKRTLLVLTIVAVISLGAAQLNAQDGVTLEDVAEKLRLLTREVVKQDAFSNTLATRVADVENRLEALENPPTPTPSLTTTPAPTPTPVSAAETVIVVTISRGNVRDGPGMHHDIVGKVSKGDTLEGPFQETEGWYQFCCIDNGEKAWVSSTLVSVRNEAEPTVWENARKEAIDVDPETLIRYHVDYIGATVYFSNVYVWQGTEDYVIVSLDDTDNHIGWLTYKNTSPRVLEEDRVDFVAQVEGIHIYTSSEQERITSLLLKVIELRLSK